MAEELRIQAIDLAKVLNGFQAHPNQLLSQV